MLNKYTVWSNFLKTFDLSLWLARNSCSHSPEDKHWCTYFLNIIYCCGKKEMKLVKRAVLMDIFSMWLVILNAYKTENALFYKSTLEWSLFMTYFVSQRQLFQSFPYTKNFFLQNSKINVFHTRERRNGFIGVILTGFPNIRLFNDVKSKMGYFLSHLENAFSHCLKP